MQSMSADDTTQLVKPAAADNLSYRAIQAGGLTTVTATATQKLLPKRARGRMLSVVRTAKR